MLFSVSPWDLLHTASIPVSCFWHLNFIVVSKHLYVLQRHSCPISFFRLPERPRNQLVNELHRCSMWWHWPLQQLSHPHSSQFTFPAGCSKRGRNCNVLAIQPLTGWQSWIHTVSTRKKHPGNETTVPERSVLKGMELAVSLYFAFGNGNVCSRWIRQKWRSWLGQDTSLTLSFFNTGQGRTTNFAGCHLFQTTVMSKGCSHRSQTLREQGTRSSLISVTSLPQRKLCCLGLCQ